MELTQAPFQGHALRQAMLSVAITRQQRLRRFNYGWFVAAVVYERLGEEKFNRGLGYHGRPAITEVQIGIAGVAVSNARRLCLVNVNIDLDYTF